MPRCRWVVAAADGSEEDANALEQYAYDLGLVFQIVDDVLDVTAAEENARKTRWQRCRKRKNDVCNLVRVEACQKACAGHDRARLPEADWPLWSEGGVLVPDGTARLNRNH